MKSMRALNTYVIVFLVVAAAWALTYLVPVGKFEVLEKYVWDPGHAELSEHIALDPDSFEYVLNPSGQPDRRGVPLFGAHHGVGLFNYVFEGIVDSVGIVTFILVIGGAFGIILKTGAIEAGMMSVIRRLGGAEIAVIPVLFIVFSFGGATFGMGEEAIPFAMIVVPLVVALGYDAITGILITYGATQVGFAASWMNPFSIAIAQGIAGLPIMSGLGFRVVLFALFTTVGTLFTLWYAQRIKKDPTRSLSYESDEYFRRDFNETPASGAASFGLGHIVVLAITALGILWVAVGVIAWDYYIPEIATQFLIMGLAAGIVAVVFRLGDMTVGGIAEAFVAGARDLLGAALVVGMAKGILIILSLGADPTDPTQANLLNTILFNVGNGLRRLPAVLSAWFMYLFQAVFNFFVPSGSGKAALTMPLMAPLTSYAGVSRQVSVLAFQLGDGFTNMIVPTSGALMGVLAVARVDWVKWFRSQAAFQGLLFGMSTVILIFAVLGGGLLGADWLEPDQLAARGRSSAVVGAGGATGVYDLGPGERSVITVPVEAGGSYDIVLVDSYNLLNHAGVVAEDHVLRALYFEVDGASYTEPEGEGGVTPESDKPAARVTPAGSEMIITVEGYKPAYTGRFALVVKTAAGKDIDPSTFGLENLAGPEAEDASVVYRRVDLRPEEEKWIGFRVTEGETYRLYMVDSYNNRQNGYPIPGKEILRSFQFELFRPDKASSYARLVYRQLDEDKGAGVSPEGNEVDIAPPAAVFTAQDDVVYLRIAGYNPEYAGTFGYVLITGDYVPPSAGDAMGPALAPDLAADLPGAMAGVVGEWWIQGLGAGERRVISFDVVPGTDYTLHFADGYSNEALGNVLSDPIDAGWFLVMDEAAYLLYPETSYLEAESASAYGAVGGYSATDDGPSAVFTARTNRLLVLVEGSKTSYEGQIGLRLEAQ